MSDLTTTTIETGAKIIPLFKFNPPTIGDNSLPGETPRGPIESKMRRVISSIGDSKYQDTFDWSIYDKIGAKFGKTPPRGGVVFNTGLKLVNYHASCSKCHYAFEIDTYGRGCTHNCVYCYAKEILTRHGYWNEPHPFPLNLADVRKIFYTVFETDKKSRWREILEKRIPLRLGSMSDCFMWMEKKYRVTHELIKVLNFYRYPHIVFTRSDLVAHEDYLKVFDRHLISIQMSMSGGDEALTRAIEPGAPGIKRRFEALRILAENQLWTTVRINPLFPMYPDGYYTDPQSIIDRFGSRESVPYFPLFEWSFVEQLRAAKVPSVVAGVVRLSPFAIRAISKETGIDLSQFFKPQYYSKTSESRFSDSEIAFYYKKLQDLCSKNGIRFNTCYIGNGVKDYFQYQELWDNKEDCCDARGKVNSFKTSSQDVSWDTRVIHSPSKKDALETRINDSSIEKHFRPNTFSLQSNPHEE